MGVTLVVVVEVGGLVLGGVEVAGLVVFGSAAGRLGDWMTVDGAVEGASSAGKEVVAGLAVTVGKLLGNMCVGIELVVVVVVSVLEIGTSVTITGV